MSKYYKAEDVFHRFQRFFKAYAGWEKSQLKIILDDIPTIEVSEDCISREWIYDALLEYGFTAPDMTVTELIDEAPSVVPSRAEGEWIIHFDDLFPEDSTMECSACHEEQPLGIDDNFCPNCGAKMKG